MVLFESFENPSMGALDCEIVHVVKFSHFLEDYEKELISIHSFENQKGSPQANFQMIDKTKPELFDEQEDSLDTHIMAIIFKEVQRCMNVFVEVHGKVEFLVL
jgi:hypothetical protein